MIGLGCYCAILFLMEDLHARFARFEATPPDHLIGDPIWRLPAYRLALFLSDVVDEDVVVLTREAAPFHSRGQLHRSVHSIEANICEGYGRQSGKDRARYFETALSSAREARGWYYRVRTWIGLTQTTERLSFLTRIVKILTVAVPMERRGDSEIRIERAKRRRENLGEDGKSKKE